MPYKKLDQKPKARPAQNSAPMRLRFEAIGTQWTIDLYDAEIDSGIQNKIRARINEFDRTYSRFRPDSWVTKLSFRAGAVALPNDAQPMLDFYQELYSLTGGSVTPLIGQTLSDAGYGATYSFQPKHMSTPPSWQASIQYTSKEFTTSQPVLLDFGAAGKGYLVDIISDLLRKNSITSFCINAGGDIRCENSPEPLKIGLEHPGDHRQVIGVSTLQNGSICGSAGNRRKWANFHHIIDPKRLRSPEHISALWATAENTMVADGVSTALYFVEPQILKAAYNFEYAIMYADNSIDVSSNFPAQFFTDES